MANTKKYADFISKQISRERNIGLIEPIVEEKLDEDKAMKRTEKDKPIEKKEAKKGYMDARHLDTSTKGGAGRGPRKEEIFTQDEVSRIEEIVKNLDEKKDDKDNNQKRCPKCGGMIVPGKKHVCAKKSK